MDYSGTVEIACFDDKMTQAQLAIEEHEVILCRGVVQVGRKEGEWRFNLQEVQSLSQIRAAKQPMLHIELHEQDWTDRLAENLKICLGQQKKGPCKVVIWYIQKGVRLRLNMRNPLRMVVDDACMHTIQAIRDVAGVYLSYS